jgi:YHS domain-containing protein
MENKRCVSSETFESRATHDSQRGVMAKDPVCGMTVDEKKAKWKSEYEGKTYYFCAERCKQAFDKNPKRFVK